MNYSDRLAFMPLRYLMPLVWLSIILATSTFSYFYVQDKLTLGVKENILSHMSERFSQVNNNLEHALKLGIKEEDLIKTQNSFEFEDNPETIMGYIKKDGSSVLLSGKEKTKNLEYFLKKDFQTPSEILNTIKTKLCNTEESQYIVWANTDVFYIFRPLLDTCEGDMHFLRFSIKHEKEEHVTEMLNIIFVYTIVLIGAMFIVGSFSYSVISHRFNTLLKNISEYKQGMSIQQQQMGGRDELSKISRAFCLMSHKMNAVLDDMYTFVAVLDPKGHIHFTNNTPLQASEISFSDVQGKKLCDAYWWEYSKDVRDEIDELISRCINGEIINHETQIQIANGRLIWINFSMHPVYNENGDIEHLVAEGVDISKQKQAFEDMLRHSRKAQMGEMISVIAHQWRQPLAIISSVAGKVLLENELGLRNDKDIRKSMDKINSTVEHLGSTMTQFTNFFNPNKKSSQTSFSEIVKKSISIIGSKLASEGIEIDIDVKHETKIQSFEEELMQVLMDMMKNSADFFKINNVHKSKISLKQFIKDDYICLSIEDNAGGIKDEDMEDLFKPYFSTKPQDGGTGLGLHMSKMIVEDHCSGKIEVEQLEDGARFIICLPLV